MNQKQNQEIKQLKTTCKECFLLKDQVIPAQHYWNKGFFECRRFLCKSCYWEAQINWIIWETKEKQAITNYLTNSEESTQKYL
jgi:hypothetical protein